MILGRLLAPYLVAVDRARKGEEIGMALRKQAKSNPARVDSGNRRSRANNRVDEASIESMDASDPPSFNPSTIGRSDDHRAGTADFSRSPRSIESTRTSQTTTDAKSREQLVREKSYLIWLSEGRPSGRDKAHWYLAEQLMAADDKKEDR